MASKEATGRSDLDVLVLPSEARALLDAIPGPAMLLDDGHTILAANAELVALVGLGLDEILGERCTRLIHGVAEPPRGCPLRACVAAGGGRVSHEMNDEPTGERVRATVSPTALSSPGGRPVFLHTMTDITREVEARDQLERARRTVHQHLQAQRVVSAILRRSVEDAELDAILVDALDLLLRTHSFAAESKAIIFTLDAARGALRMRASVGISAALRDACALVALGRCLCGRASASGAPLITAHVGERHEVLVDGMPDHGDVCLPIRFEGRVLGVLNLCIPAGRALEKSEEAFLQAVTDTLASVIARDDAERRRRLLQAEMRHTQKMDAIGRLAGGVAHDFNNLLAVIQGYGEMVAEDIGPDHPAAADMQEVLGAATSATALTRQLLGLSRRGPADPEVLKPDEALAGMQRMLARLLGERIALEMRVGAGDLELNVDRSHLEQILLNLVVNGRDAMPDGGTLEITTEQIERHEGPERRRWWVLEVCDQGVGMTEDVRARLFDPFFTTKGEGRGTGLGLSTVRDIVSGYDGSIEVESSVGEGTTMRVMLPGWRADWTRLSARHMPSVSLQHSGTALVVDDESGVRNVLRRILTRRGFHVLEADSAESALEMECVHRGEIDVLVTDVIMPGLDGFGLANEMAVRRPGIATVFVSGYPAEMLAQYGLEPDDLNMVRKPFESRSLLDAIAAAREGRAPGACRPRDA